MEPRRNGSFRQIPFWEPIGVENHFVFPKQLKALGCPLGGVRGWRHVKSSQISQGCLSVCYFGFHPFEQTGRCPCHFCQNIRHRRIRVSFRHARAGQCDWLSMRQVERTPDILDVASLTGAFGSEKRAVPGLLESFVTLEA